MANIIFCLNKGSQLWKLIRLFLRNTFNDNEDKSSIKLLGKLITLILHIFSSTFLRDLSLLPLEGVF